MKEIKYKAWDSKKQMWTNYQIVDNMIYFMDKVTGVWVRENKYPDRFKLMQYTGLKDKNGKEIYEGNIVSYATYSYDEPIEDYEGVIKIGAYGTFIDGYNSNGDKDIYYLLEVSDCINHLEKLGNIYENPDILKEMEEGI